MNRVTIAVAGMLLICLCAIGYNVFKMQTPAPPPLVAAVKTPPPPVAPPVVPAVVAAPVVDPPGFVIVSVLYEDGKPRMDELAKRFDLELCKRLAASINKRWRDEDRLGVATCKEVFGP